jgi:hypothetical protein
MNFRDPYIQINSILLIGLFGIFSYSYFYPLLDDQGMTVSSSCEGMPAMYCKSRGLSRAFAQLVHGNVEKAVALNKHAVSVFTFFGIQFFGRILFSLVHLKMKSSNLIVIDSVFSGIYFVYTFFPLTFLST